MRGAVAAKFYVITFGLVGVVLCNNEGERGGPYDQVQAVRGLLQRLIPAHADQFDIVVRPDLTPVGRDSFKIESKDGKILVTANSGYSAASGVHYYLKRFCDCHVSWSGNQLQLPEVLPTLPTSVKKISNDKYRYYMNVCTFSYSTVWWDWDRWEKEIDWMALNGINLPLAFTGQEYIWKKVFRALSFTDHDIDEFFTGPAFLAWNRMGNVQGWAGPLSDNWLVQQMQLQHRILQRMRSFGMTPVLPAFSGRVPPSITRVYPNASISYLAKKWGNFDPPYGPVTFLEPSDPLFPIIGEIFLERYIEEYGTDHMYNLDLFNEMPPTKNTTDYLTVCGEQVYNSVVSVDPEAIWVLQGWMFYSDQSYWSEELAEAFLTSVPIGRMLVLDLQSEMYPQYKRLNSFYGQPFIWCMLHNYGGVEGLYGSMNDVNTGPFDARAFNGSTMVGTGLTPEGIETNDVVYELMNEAAWFKRPVRLNHWLSKYVLRRYGATSREIQVAWRFLKRSVYDATAPYRNHGKYILTIRPSLKMKRFVWYNSSDVFKAWTLFVNASVKSPFNESVLYRHDLVDVARQSLQLIADCLYSRFLQVYRAKKWAEFRNISSQILNLYDDLEELLVSDKHFLLGNWLKSAVARATTPLERKQYLYNARNQITLWGPSGQILDYATKQWGGVISKYYRKRWKLFIKMLEEKAASGQPFIQSEYNAEVLDTVATPFTMDDGCGAEDPVGDPVEISERLLRKYENLFTCK